MTPENKQIEKQIHFLLMNLEHADINLQVINEIVSRETKTAVEEIQSLLKQLDEKITVAFG